MILLTDSYSSGTRIRWFYRFVSLFWELDNVVFFAEQTLALEHFLVGRGVKCYGTR